MRTFTEPYPERTRSFTSFRMTTLFDIAIRLCETLDMGHITPCTKCGKPMTEVTREGARTQVCTACDTPDRTCTWCKVPMTKKLVGDGQYLHYICPKCVFQHTSKYPGKAS